MNTKKIRSNSKHFLLVNMIICTSLYASNQLIDANLLSTPTQTHIDITADDIAPRHHEQHVEPPTSILPFPNYIDSPTRQKKKKGLIHAHEVLMNHQDDINHAIHTGILLARRIIDRSAFTSNNATQQLMADLGLFLSDTIPLDLNTPSSIHTCLERIPLNISGTQSSTSFNPTAYDTRNTLYTILSHIPKVLLGHSSHHRTSHELPANFFALKEHSSDSFKNYAILYLLHDYLESVYSRLKRHIILTINTHAKSHEHADTSDTNAPHEHPLQSIDDSVFSITSRHLHTKGTLNTYSYIFEIRPSSTYINITHEWDLFLHTQLVEIITRIYPPSGNPFTDSDTVTAKHDDINNFKHDLITRMWDEFKQHEHYTTIKTAHINDHYLQNIPHSCYAFF